MPKDNQDQSKGDAATVPPLPINAPVAPVTKPVPPAPPTASDARAIADAAVDQDIRITNCTPQQMALSVKQPNGLMKSMVVPGRGHLDLRGNPSDLGPDVRAKMLAGHIRLS